MNNHGKNHARRPHEKSKKSKHPIFFSFVPLAPPSQLSTSYTSTNNNGIISRNIKLQPVPIVGSERGLFGRGFRGYIEQLGVCGELRWGRFKIFGLGFCLYYRMYVLFEDNIFSCLWTAALDVNQYTASGVIWCHKCTGRTNLFWSSYNIMKRDRIIEWDCFFRRLTPFYL